MRWPSNPSMVDVRSFQAGQRHALGPRAQPQHPMVRSDEQRCAIFAKRHVGGGNIGDDAAEAGAVRRENMNAARSSRKDIAVNIDLETVGYAIAFFYVASGFSEQPTFVEGAVGPDAVSLPDRFLGRGISHVQRLEIRRETKSVRCFEIGDYRDDRTVLRDVENCIEGQLFFGVGESTREPEWRIGEIQRA